MHDYIAFLRGMNLGNRRIKMDELRRHFETLKFKNVTTFIASGNVLFSSPSADEVKLVAKIEAELARVLEYRVDTFIRSRAAITAIATSEPFAREELSRPGNTIHVGFLREPLSAAQSKALVACRTDADEFVVSGREFFWLCRIKTHESKVWTTAQMKAVRMPTCTQRNLTTIRKIAALYPSG
ncbi:MAG: DUF1697 domain-containing protein [Opitutus sp.]